MKIKVREYVGTSLGKTPAQEVGDITIYMPGQTIRIKEIKGQLHVTVENGRLLIKPFASNGVTLEEYHG